MKKRVSLLCFLCAFADLIPSSFALTPPPLPNPVPTTGCLTQATVAKRGTTGLDTTSGTTISCVPNCLLPAKLVVDAATGAYICQ